MEISEKIEQIARSAMLLVAADFDGTLAPIVSDPGAAAAHAEALGSLRALAALPRTHVAIVSGRALADLERRVEALGKVLLVGSHGNEFQASFSRPLDAEHTATLATITDTVEAFAARMAGSLVERKPVSVAFHYRNVESGQAAKGVEELLGAVETRPPVHVRHGKKVVEFIVAPENKGTALAALRRWVGANAACFIGDDTTDEDAFVTLEAGDLAVKVGEGPTAAAWRVVDTEAVARLLAELSRQRAAYTAEQGW